MVFTKTTHYLQTLDLSHADDLDKTAYTLIHDLDAYERASQALRRRFVRGAQIVEGIDRGGRLTHIKRQREGGTYVYYIEGEDGSWSSPDERLWIVAMYALWQAEKHA